MFYMRSLMDLFLLLLDCHDVSSFLSMSRGTVLSGEKKALDETAVIISGKRKKIWISYFRANCR